MAVSNMKAISLLAFVLVNCEFGFSQPHPKNFEHSAKRDIIFSNPIFNKVFRNKNPEQGLMRKFMGDDGSDITNNESDYYVIRIPIDDGNLEFYLDQNQSDSEKPIENMDQNTGHNTVKQKTITEVIGQNPDQIPIKEETSTEIMGQNTDQKIVKEEMSSEVMDQNPDQKPFNESLQVSQIPQETPAQSFIVVVDEIKRGEPVSLTVVKENNTNEEKYSTDNLSSKTSKGCVPRFQSEITIEEQKMLTHFMNLVEPQANQNKKNILNPCRENETVIDTEKNTTTDSGGHSKYTDNKFTSQEITNQSNFDGKPAPLESQPNTLVRDDEVMRDGFFLFEEDQTLENNPHDETHNIEVEEEKVSFSPVPVIPYILVLNSNITAKNETNPDISSTRDALDTHEFNKGNNDPDEREDFNIGSPIPIIPYKPTVQIKTIPTPQRSPGTLIKIYESEISNSKEKRKDIEKTGTTTHPTSSDVESDTTVKPQSTLPGSLSSSVNISQYNERPNRSTNVAVQTSNITEHIGHHNNTIKTQRGKGFISSHFKFTEKSDKPLTTKSGPTDKSSTIAKYIQSHHRNITNEEVQKFSNGILELWSSPKPNQILGNRKTLSTNKPMVNKKQNDERPNSKRIKLLQNSSNGVSAPGLEITTIRHGTAAPKRGTPGIRRKTAAHRHGTSVPSRGTDQDGLMSSILSRILQAVLRSDHQTPNFTKRISRDLGAKRNKYVPKIVLNSIARKFFAPKYFPKSGKKVFTIPGGSALETLPANFRQGNYEPIRRNLVDSNLERKAVITLADIFNGDYLRTARSNTLKDHSEEFEQIM